MAVPNYTEVKTLNTTGVLLTKFDCSLIDTLTIVADADWYLTFDQAGAASTGFKVLANSAVEFDQTSFSAESKAQRKVIMIYGKVSAGTTSAYVATMGVY